MNALLKWFYKQVPMVKIMIYVLGFSSWAYIFGYLLYIDGYINSFIGNYFMVVLGSISIVNLVIFIFAISYVIAGES